MLVFIIICKIILLGTNYSAIKLQLLSCLTIISVKDWIFSVLFILKLVSTLSTCSVAVSSVDTEPTAAAVSSAGPSSAPGCSHAALSQPTEQHHWGQHLCLRSHTHYPAAPITAHPDCPRKPKLSIVHQSVCKSWCIVWSISVFFGMVSSHCFYFHVATTTARYKPAAVCLGSAWPPDRYTTAARPVHHLTDTASPTRSVWVARLNIHTKWVRKKDFNSWNCFLLPFLVWFWCLRHFASPESSYSTTSKPS